MKELTIEELLKQPNFAEAMGLVIYTACGKTYMDIALNLIEDTCNSSVSNVTVTDIAIKAGQTVMDKI